jgi:small-conductance mechanosensitive channel
LLGLTRIAVFASHYPNPISREDRLARFVLKGSWRSYVSIVLFLVFVGALPYLRASAQPAPAGNGAILAHLNAAIGWYHRVAGLDITAGQPSDILYVENARHSASQALQLAFQASQAQAVLLAKQKQTPNAGNATTSPDQPASDQQASIAKVIAGTNDRISQTQSQLDGLNKQIGSAKAKQRQQLISQRDTLQGELDLDKTILDALQKIASVSSSGENGQGGLAGQINQLKQSVPEVFAADGKQSSVAAAQSSKSSGAQTAGLFGLTSILFGQMRDIHDIDQLMSETSHLRDTVDKLDAPLRDSLKGLVQQGRDMVNQSPTSDPAQIAAKRQKFETLTAQFKQVSAAAVPLRQEMILLDECRGDLQEWRDSIESEYGRVLRTLLTRVGVILVALAFVFVLSELWRHATYRYVRDTRRRRQLMLIRRAVTGFLMVLVVALGFVSEFSSLATFAGFITAGIAVALQTVILSVAAYFFLIGRYGVRVGDRITVSGVTGDVIEIGLVRLYLMELSGTGIDLYPTGRVVVFSNAVMFQAAPFFKQFPGTAYAWHEVAVTLAPGVDHAAVEQKLLDAVTSVYDEYRHNIDRQHSLVERTLDSPVAAPTPKAQFLFGETGPEFVVRYPVELPQAAEIDGKITRKLIEAISNNAELKAAVVGSPKLQAAIKA